MGNMIGDALIDKIKNHGSQVSKLSYSILLPPPIIDMHSARPLALQLLRKAAINTKYHLGIAGREKKSFASGKR